MKQQFSDTGAETVEDSGHWEAGKQREGLHHFPGDPEPRGPVRAGTQSDAETPLLSQNLSLWKNRDWVPSVTHRMPDA